MSNNEYTEQEMQAYMKELEQINKNKKIEESFNRFNTIAEVSTYIQDELDEIRDLEYSKYIKLDNIKSLYITGLEGLQQRILIKESLEGIVKKLSMLENGLLNKINILLDVGTGEYGTNIIELLKQNARRYAIIFD